MNLLLVNTLAIGITLIYASCLDIRDRRVPFRTWYPMLAIGVPVALYIIFRLYLEDPQIFFRYLLTAGLFSVAFYLFAYFRLFGGADAWALIFITLLHPFFPFAPCAGYPPFAFFPFSVLINALLLNLATPLGIFAMNVIRGNRAPLIHMFLGFPVSSEALSTSYGFVMERLVEREGRLERSFIPVRESLAMLFSGRDRLYTRDLRVYPERYEKERALIEKAGGVWISYGVPFIVPITAGFFSALLVGDLLQLIMRVAGL
ncbi:MAG: A24 family peptidase C-terminal domain-containing protein [Methanomicrobiales archaeon]|nr:A24 family peptidase C-terminal domain-containing protein [Methanomicrobiales archaeon]